MILGWNMTQPCFCQVSWDSWSNYIYIYFFCAKLETRSEILCLYMDAINSPYSYNELCCTGKLKMLSIAPSPLKNILWGFFSSADETITMNIKGKCLKALLFSTFKCNPFMFYKLNVLSYETQLLLKLWKMKKSRKAVKLEGCSILMISYLISFLIWKTEDQRL